MANLCQAYGYGVASPVRYKCDEVQQAVIRCDEFRLQRLGATKSMAILKGDWVITNDEIGQVELLDYMNDGTGRWHLVRVPSLSFASLRSERGMVKVDPVFSKLLTVVNKEE